jgi:hypothetical protein
MKEWVRRFYFDLFHPYAVALTLRAHPELVPSDASLSSSPVPRCTANVELTISLGIHGKNVYVWMMDE